MLHSLSSRSAFCFSQCMGECGHPIGPDCTSLPIHTFCEDLESLQIKSIFARKRKDWPVGIRFPPWGQQKPGCGPWWESGFWEGREGRFFRERPWDGKNNGFLLWDKWLLSWYGADGVPATTSFWLLFSFCFHILWPDKKFPTKVKGANWSATGFHNELQDKSQVLPLNMSLATAAQGYSSSAMSPLASETRVEAKREE